MSLPQQLLSDGEFLLRTRAIPALYHVAYSHISESANRPLRVPDLRSLCLQRILEATHVSEMRITTRRHRLYDLDASLLHRKRKIQAAKRKNSEITFTLEDENNVPEECFRLETLPLPKNLIEQLQHLLCWSVLIFRVSDTVRAMETIILTFPNRKIHLESENLRHFLFNKYLLYENRSFQHLRDVYWPVCIHMTERDFELDWCFDQNPSYKTQNPLLGPIPWLDHPPSFARFSSKYEKLIEEVERMLLSRTVLTRK